MRVVYISLFHYFVKGLKDQRIKRGPISKALWIDWCIIIDLVILLVIHSLCTPSYQRVYGLSNKPMNRAQIGCGGGESVRNGQRSRRL